MADQVWYKERETRETVEERMERERPQRLEERMERERHDGGDRKEGFVEERNRLSPLVSVQRLTDGI